VSAPDRADVNVPRAEWRPLASSVEILSPRSGAPFPEFLEATVESAGTPFSDSRRAAVAALSAAFLQDAVLRRDAASVAVAYWMRAAEVERVAERFAARSAAEPQVVRVPVGRVFHVAPSNVDTLFVYSWALAFLCGNTNVVRVSRERPPVVDSMLGAIDAVARAHPELRDGNRFVTYEHDAEITTALSRWCSHRILWGGDETVANLRPLPLNPHASERVFGSKFSYAIVSAAAYLAADETERAKLAGAFFNDLFWFDQMACSSPQVLFWVGAEEEFARAVPEFEDRLQREVERREHATPTPNAMQRLTYAFELAARADVRVHLEHPGFVGVRVRDSRGLAKETCGGGLIRHTRLDRVADLVPYASEADQTVTHWGFDVGDLKALAGRIGARGVDRLVPIGEALAFDTVWDGFDLLDDLTRRVAVRG
jgi:hypothetical protein